MDALLLGQQCPPYTYPNPTRNFIFNFLIISFILLKINAFPMRYEIWKGRKKVWQKVGSNSGRSYQKAQTLPSAPLKLMFNQCWGQRITSNASYVII